MSQQFLELVGSTIRCYSRRTFAFSRLSSAVFGGQTNRQNTISCSREGQQDFPIHFVGETKIARERRDKKPIIWRRWSGRLAKHETERERENSRSFTLFSITIEHWLSAVNSDKKKNRNSIQTCKIMFSLNRIEKFMVLETFDVTGVQVLKSLHLTNYSSEINYVLRRFYQTI